MIQARPNTEAGWKCFTRLRIFGAGVLVVGAIVLLICPILPHICGAFSKPEPDFTLSYAYLGYIVVMFQFAFRLARKYSEKWKAWSASITLGVAWPLATIALLGPTLDNSALTSLSEKSAFIAFILTSVASLFAMLVDGLPRAASAQTIAWVWQQAPWETATPTQTQSTP